MVQTRSSLARRSLQQRAPSFQTMNLCRPRKHRKPRKKFNLVSGFYSTPAAEESPAEAAEAQAEAEAEEPPMEVAEDPAAAAEAPAVAQPPVPTLGSTSDMPLQIPCEEEEEEKVKVNPLSRLRPAPNPRRRNANSAPNHEQSSQAIVAVKEVLVSQLISGETQKVDSLVDYANDAFAFLDRLGADYTCLYNNVKNFIGYQYDLYIAERDRNMMSFPELRRRYEEVVVCTDDIEEELFRNQANLERAKEMKTSLKRKMTEARELICRLKLELADIEENEKSLKDEGQKYIAAHEIAQSEMQKLGTQVEAADMALVEIKRRKDAALEGITSTTRLLHSKDKPCF